MSFKSKHIQTNNGVDELIKLEDDGTGNPRIPSGIDGSKLTGLSSSGGGAFEEITENSKTGIRVKGADPLNYGDIGNNAVDLSRSVTTSSTRGATGLYSFACGANITASGNYSVALGNSSVASGTDSFAVGNQNTASGTGGVALNRHNTSAGIDSFTSGIYSEVSSGKLQSFAIGHRAITTGNYSGTFGRNIELTDANKIGFGYSDTSITKNNTNQNVKASIDLANGDIDTDGDITATGDVTANSFIGDGSGLTDIPGTMGVVSVFPNSADFQIFSSHITNSYVKMFLFCSCSDSVDGVKRLTKEITMVYDGSGVLSNVTNTLLSDDDFLSLNIVLEANHIKVKVTSTADQWTEVKFSTIKI